MAQLQRSVETLGALPGTAVQARIIDKYASVERKLYCSPPCISVNSQATSTSFHAITGHPLTTKLRVLYGNSNYLVRDYDYCFSCQRNPSCAVQLVNFSVVPIHLQVPYVAAVSFVWTIILSMMRGSDTGTVEEKQDAQATIEHPSATATVVTTGKGVVDEKESAQSASAVAPAPTAARSGGEKVLEGSVASGTGVPIGGILAVVRIQRNSSHACWRCMEHWYSGLFCSKLDRAHFMWYRE